MRLRKNWFFTAAMFIYFAMAGYAAAATFGSLGQGQKYPYLLKAEWILLMLALAFLLWLFGFLWYRSGLAAKFSRHEGVPLWTETILVLAVLFAGTLVRIYYVRRMPMAPESDYKTYYEIAKLLESGTLIEDGPGYCDYIAMFPHVIGYPAFLSVIFRIFGSSVMTAVYFNVALAMGTCLLVWRVARRLTGRLCGWIALVAAAFWPSQIIYNNFAAGEYLFTFLLMVCVDLFVLQMGHVQAEEKHPWSAVILLCLLGFFLAVASVVRPMAVIFLVAALICMLPGKRDRPAKPANDIPLGIRASADGWKRCLTVLVVYLAFSRIFSAATAYAIDETPAGGSVSFGYNLLVGLNTDSYGGWNQEDADYLYDALDKTGSADGAMRTCRDLAFERLHTDPKVLLDLFAHKFEVLWGNDDYGCSWNILFMNQQGNLTAARESFLYSMMHLGDLYYLTILVFGLVGGIALFRRKPDSSFAIILMILGTIALHLLVENQNRYHFHVLSLLPILAAVALRAILDAVGRNCMAAQYEAQRRKEQAQERARIIAQTRADEAERARLRAEALHAQFDIGKALREGHVNITMSEASTEPTEEDILNERRKKWEEEHAETEQDETEHTEVKHAEEAHTEEEQKSMQ